MLDYGSEDIDSMDDDAGEEEAQNPPFTGRWTATSSYDVYMVDAPKDNSWVVRLLCLLPYVPLYRLG